MTYIEPGSVEDTASEVDLWDLQYLCRFFGGSRPLSTATVYRLIKRGVVPAPVSVGGSSRWIATECRTARARMVESRIVARDPRRGRPPVAA